MVTWMAWRADSGIAYFNTIGEAMQYVATSLNCAVYKEIGCGCDITRTLVYRYNYNIERKRAANEIRNK